MMDRVYPDISDLLARKAQARLERAKMPYGQKVFIVEKCGARFCHCKKRAVSVANSKWRQRPRRAVELLTRAA